MRASRWDKKCLLVQTLEPCRRIYVQQKWLKHLQIVNFFDSRYARESLQIKEREGINHFLGNQNRITIIRVRGKASSTWLTHDFRHIVHLDWYSSCINGILYSMLTFVLFVGLYINNPSINFSLFSLQCVLLNSSSSLASSSRIFLHSLYIFTCVCFNVFTFSSSSCCSFHMECWRFDAP